MKNTGLVLEGGGLRALYTAGILEFFLEKKLFFKYVVGVSAGASVSVSYISRQKGRNKKVNIDLLEDNRFLSFRNLFREKSLFGMNFLYNTIPNQLVPFDFTTFFNSGIECKIGATNCQSGKISYFSSNEMDNTLLLQTLRASASLPFLSPKVMINNSEYLDGGIADPVPIMRSIKDGNTKHVVILTRNKGYIKKPMPLNGIAKIFYRKHENLIRALQQRHIVYNNTIAYIEELEKKGSVFIIRPLHQLKVGRMEKSRAKVQALYDAAQTEAAMYYDQLSEWLHIK